MVWDIGRRVRGALNQDHRVRVAVRCSRCRCRRTVATLFGDVDHIRQEYDMRGGVPRRFTANEPGRRWRCAGGHEVPVRADRLTAAYRDAASSANREIMLP